jgi:tetratricopeptide (TPR) repeat protein
VDSKLDKHERERAWRRMKDLHRPAMHLFVGMLIAVAVAGFALAQQDKASDSISEYFRGVGAIQRGDLEEAAKALRQATARFQKQEFTKGEFMAYLASADLYRIKGDYEKALSELKKADNIATRFKDIRGAAVVLSRMGRIEADRSRLDKAVELLKKALSNASAVEETGLVANIKSQLARFEITRGQLGRAEKLLDEALIIHEKTYESRYLAIDFQSLAQIKRLRNEYAPALELIDKAISVAANLGLQSLLNRMKLEKAGILLDQGNIKASRKLLDTSLEFSAERNDRRLSAEVRAGLARLLLLQDKPEDADRLLDKASKDLSGLDAPMELISVQLQKGRALTRLGRLPQAEGLLTKTLDFAAGRRAVYAEMQLRIALSRVQALQGKCIEALRNAEGALEPAKRIASRQTLADHHVVMGLIRRQIGNYAAAVESYQLGLDMNKSLNNAQAETDCVIARASSLISLGFLDQAAKDLAGVKKMKGPAEQISRTGRILFLQGRIAAAAGNWDSALNKYNQATAIFGKIDRPWNQAAILQARAHREAGLRNLESAYSQWEEAEKVFVRMGSPGGVLMCRTAKVDLALDMGDLHRAATVARKNIRVSGAVRPKPRRHAVGGAQIAGGKSAVNPYVMLVQGFRFPSQMRFPQQSPDAGRYFRQQDSEGIGRQNNKGPDDVVFNADLLALRARVAMASGDIAPAEKEIKDALKSVTAVKDDRSVARLNALLAQILVKKGRYAQAVQAFRKSGRFGRREIEHAEAMDLAAKNKKKESIEALEKCIKNMMDLEKTEGLWLVPPRVMREKIALFEDLVELILKSKGKPESTESIRKAWDYAQITKMRRVLYQMASIGAWAFPGVPPQLLDSLRARQFASINANSRNRNAQLAKKFGLSMTALKTATDANSVGKIDKILRTASTKHGRFVSIFLSNAPGISEVAGLLSKQEAYLSFLTTDKGIHSFLLSGNYLRTHSIWGSPDKIAQQAASIRKDVSNPHAYRITETSSDLWKALFGGFEKEVLSRTSLVIEPDAFLLTFPFEALVPGELPRSYKEQQAAPLLMDKLEIFRSTSAFRFVGQRSKKSSDKKPAGALVFAKPAFSLEGRTRKPRTNGASFLSMWKRPLGKFRSSPVFQDSGQAAKIAGIFGKEGKLLEGERASVSAFVAKNTGKRLYKHVACPVLIPDITAGGLRQPFIVFAPDNSEQSGGFFGMRDLMSVSLPAEVITFPWISTESDSGDGLTLLVEALSIAGIRWIVFPLWQADRQGEAEASEYLTGFYSALKAGGTIESARKQGREAMASENASGRKNRCSPARLAVY